jgi:hypothetical protein
MTPSPTPNTADANTPQFSSLILYGFGFSTFKTLLLRMPVGAVILVFVLLSYIPSPRFSANLPSDRR